MNDSKENCNETNLIRPSRNQEGTNNFNVDMKINYEF